MGDYIKIASKSELPPPGEAREFACGSKMLCVANIGGTLSAMDNVCLHRGGPLGQGIIEGDKIICPWHGWMWNTKTGEATHSPEVKIAVYAIKVDGEDVVVQMPDASPTSPTTPA